MYIYINVYTCHLCCLQALERELFAMNTYQGLLIVAHGIYRSVAPSP